MVVSIINKKLGQIDGGDRKEVKELKNIFSKCRNQTRKTRGLRSHDIDVIVAVVSA